MRCQVPIGRADFYVKCYCLRIPVAAYVFLGDEAIHQFSLSVFDCESRSISGHFLGFEFGVTVTDTQCTGPMLVRFVKVTA